MSKDIQELNTSVFLIVISKGCCLQGLKDLPCILVLGPKPLEKAWRHVLNALLLQAVSAS